MLYKKCLCVTRCCMGHKMDAAALVGQHEEDTKADKVRLLIASSADLFARDCDWQELYE